MQIRCFSWFPPSTDPKSQLHAKSNIGTIPRSYLGFSPVYKQRPSWHTCFCVSGFFVVSVCMCMWVNVLPLSKYLPVLFCNWSRFWNRVREKPEIENILQNTNIRWVQPMIKTESCLWNTYPEFSWQFVCSATVTFFRFNSSIACHSFSCLPWHPEAMVILNLLFLLFFFPCRVSINCW